MFLSFYCISTPRLSKKIPVACPRSNNPDISGAAEHKAIVIAISRAGVAMSSYVLVVSGELVSLLKPVMDSSEDQLVVTCAMEWKVENTISEFHFVGGTEYGGVLLASLSTTIKEDGKKRRNELKIWLVEEKKESEKDAQVGGFRLRQVGELRLPTENRIGILIKSEKILLTDSTTGSLFAIKPSLMFQLQYIEKPVTQPQLKARLKTAIPEIVIKLKPVPKYLQAYPPGLLRKLDRFKVYFEELQPPVLSKNELKFFIAAIMQNLELDNDIKRATFRRAIGPLSKLAGLFVIFLDLAFDKPCKLIHGIQGELFEKAVKFAPERIMWCLHNFDELDLSKFLRFFETQETPYFDERILILRKLGQHA